MQTYTGRIFPAPVCPLSQISLSARSNFSIAIAAVYRPITARFKRNFGTFTTLGACCREHLARSSVTATAVTRRLPCLTTFRTALWLVNIALGLEELLFFNTEGKCSTAIGAWKRLILKNHWTTSSLYYSVRVWVIQLPEIICISGILRCLQ